MRIDIEASTPTVLVDGENRHLGWDRYAEFHDELAAYEFENEQRGDGIEATVFVAVRLDTPAGERIVDHVFLFDVVEAVIVVLEEAVGVQRPAEINELTGKPWRVQGFEQSDVPYTEINTAATNTGITLTIAAAHTEPITVRYTPKSLLADLESIVRDYERQIHRYALGLVANPEHKELWEDYQGRLAAVAARL